MHSCPYFRGPGLNPGSSELTCGYFTCIHILYVHVHVHVIVQELQREKSQVESLQSNIPRSKSAEVTEQEQRQAK